MTPDEEVGMDTERRTTEQLGEYVDNLADRKRKLLVGIGYSVLFAANDTGEIRVPSFSAQDVRRAQRIARLYDAAFDRWYRRVWPEIPFSDLEEEPA